MLRFLWFDDVKKHNPIIKRFQFRRLVFDLTPSPAVLSTVTQNHFSQPKGEEAEVAQLLKDSWYVDDFAGGADKDQEAIEAMEGTERKNQGRYSVTYITN